MNKPECTCRIISRRGMYGKELEKCQLCKAAPELLEALRRLKTEAWRTSIEQLMYQGNDAVRLANEAIAKAEGREKRETTEGS